MKMISFGLLLFVFTAALAQAQDAATQQLIDQINGQIQNIYSVLDRQDKRIAGLEKSVSDLQNQLNQPAANNYASVDDLKKLAEQVKELAQKQQDDNELVLKQLERLAKSGGLPAVNHKSAPPPAAGPQNGYYYTIEAGDTIAAIAKAYTAKGIKVTTEQILAANPGLKPEKLIVGKKIFIPQPQ